MKQVHLDIGISSKAMAIHEQFHNNIFEKLAQESSRFVRYNKKPTITSRELGLLGDLCFLVNRLSILFLRVLGLLLNSLALKIVLPAGFMILIRIC